LDEVKEVPEVDTTVMSTSEDPKGDTAVISVEDRTLTSVEAFEPNITVSPDINPDPVTVTKVPPEVGPILGDIEDTAGIEEELKE
jgi:hypothetical protein